MSSKSTSHTHLKETAKPPASLREKAEPGIVSPPFSLALGLANDGDDKTPRTEAMTAMADGELSSSYFYGGLPHLFEVRGVIERRANIQSDDARRPLRLGPRGGSKGNSTSRIDITGGIGHAALV